MSKGMKRIIIGGIVVILVAGGFWLALKGASAPDIEKTSEDTYITENNDNSGTTDNSDAEGKTGLAHESAKDAEIDFSVLKRENPDIFGWLYIPGTNIDYPLLQSEEADDYYESHDAYGKQDEAGALYTELANLKNMCDFNTVIHGKTLADGGMFSELYRYADTDFMKEHENVYLYIEDNLLTYEIFAAYQREDSSLIRTYDFTYLSGCQQFLDDLYGTRVMGKNIKEGWEDVTPYHFLITLTTVSREDPGKQYVVVAALVQDAAGTIDRIVTE